MSQAETGRAPVAGGSAGQGWVAANDEVLGSTLMTRHLGRCWLAWLPGGLRKKAPNAAS
jgi:hypothetical protein